MANKSIATQGDIRPRVREVLNLAPGQPLTDELLIRFVRELLPMHEAADSEILAAAEWNLGEGYVSARKDKETELREWRITKDGINRQAIR